MPVEVLQVGGTASTSDIFVAAKTAWDMLMSSQLQAELLPFKIVFILFGLLFLVIIVYLLGHTAFLHWSIVGDIKPFLKPFSPSDTKALKRKWRKIAKEISKSQPVHWKIGLLKALEIVEKVLLQRQTESRILGELLDKLTVDELAHIDDLKKSYQLCQDIIHDPDFRINHSQAKEAFGVFEQILQELEYF